MLTSPGKQTPMEVNSNSNNSSSSSRTSLINKCLILTSKHKSPTNSKHQSSTTSSSCLQSTKRLSTNFTASLSKARVVLMTKASIRWEMVWRRRMKI